MATIAAVDQSKVLGVTLSNDLKWNAHVNSVCKLANRKLFLLLKLRRYGCSKASLVKFYQAIIRSALTYCFPAICNMPTSLLQSFVRVERRAMKIMSSQPKQCIGDLCDGLCRGLMKNVVKLEHHPLRCLFDDAGSSYYSLRNRRPLRPPVARTERLRNSFVKYASL